MEDTRIMKFPNYKWTVKPILGWQVQLEKRPCLWNRFWYRIVFGWVFENIEETKKDGEY